MTISQSWLNSAGLILLAAIVGLFITWYWRVRDGRIKVAESLVIENQKKAETLAVENKALVKRIDDLEKQVGLVGQAVVPLSAAFQAILVRELTHLHTPQLDELLTRIGPPSALDEEEEAELFRLLKERADELDGSIPELERDAATMLPLVMKRVKVEMAATDVPVGLTVVTTPLEPSADTGAEAVQEKQQEEGA